MKHRCKQRLGWMAIATLSSLVFVGDAAAIIGRPMTPGSVAGVARRTVRRTAVVATVATAPPAYYYAYPPPAPPPPPPPQQPAPAPR